MNALRPVINWNIVGGCNYRCSYCVQKHADGVGGPDDSQLDAALRTLAALPESFEVKLSGGEPFLLKRLPEVAAALAAAGHRVSLLTNLSAPPGRIAAFIDAAGPALRTFSCSLHLEETTAEAFIARAVAVRERLAAWPRASFVVNSVVTPGAVDALGALRRRVEAAGLKFYPQLMRVAGAAVDYDAADRAAIDRHFGDLVGPAAINRGYSHLGKPCHAGHRYFIVTPKGEAWACYPGKRHGDARLGNLFDGSLRLRSAAAPCPYAVCPCTVPQNRGIVVAG